MPNARRLARWWLVIGPLLVIEAWSLGARRYARRPPLDHFNYQNDELYCEGIPARELAEKYGTPLYVYSKATLLHHYRQIRDAFAPIDPTICYSIKSLERFYMPPRATEVTSGGESPRRNTRSSRSV